MPDNQDLLRSELQRRASSPDEPRPFATDDIVTFLDDRCPIRVVDAHEQRVDRVRACAETEDGVHVLTLGTANGNRGLVAGDSALAHFYAFVAGGRMVGPVDEDDDVVEELGDGMPAE